MEVRTVPTRLHSPTTPPSPRVHPSLYDDAGVACVSEHLGVDERSRNEWSLAELMLQSAGLSQPTSRRSGHQYPWHLVARSESWMLDVVTDDEGMLDHDSGLSHSSHSSTVSSSAPSSSESVCGAGRCGLMKSITIEHGRNSNLVRGYDSSIDARECRFEIGRYQVRSKKFLD